MRHVARESNRSRPKIRSPQGRGDACRRENHLPHVLALGPLDVYNAVHPYEPISKNLDLLARGQPRQGKEKALMTTPQVTDIFNFVQVADNLGTAGQPTAEQVAALKDAGYEVVINLATGTTPRDLPNEAALLQQRGIEYVHIPVVWEQPTADNLSQFFAAMDAHQDQKCFVHCIANMRVSAFVYLYRVLKQGVPEAEARATMNQLWEPNKVWQQFIDSALAKKG